MASNPTQRKEPADDSLAVFCANVRLLPQQAGLGKAAFVRVMGVSVRTITRLEQGECPSRLGVDAAIRLAQYVCLPVSFLFSPL